MPLRNAQKEIATAVNDHFKELLPPRIEVLGRLASWDLFNGPLNSCDECGADRLSDCTCEIRWPGFSTAIDEVSAWASENVSDLYYEADIGVLSTSEPEGFEDEETGEWVEPESYYHLDRREVVAALFGKEVAEYI